MKLSVPVVQWFRFVYAAILVSACALPVGAQVVALNQHDQATESPAAMQLRIEKLESDVAELKAIVRQLQANSPAGPAHAASTLSAVSAPEASMPSSNAPESTPPVAAPAPQNAVQQQDRQISCATQPSTWAWICITITISMTPLAA
jgi:hypothetical protein